jgi:TPR repeat protein
MISRFQVVSTWRISTKSIFAVIFVATCHLFAFPNFEEAKIAADQGNANAKAIVANYFAIGWQIAKDPAMAARYAEQSAKAGDPLGKFRLGSLLRNGEGMTKDESFGLRLQNEAAAIWSQGFDESNPFVLTAIGVALFQGKILIQDKEHAAKLYKKAADMGYAPAQFNYAMCARDGQGIPKDAALCSAYLSKAASNGYRLAQEALGQPTSDVSVSEPAASVVFGI